MTPSRPTAPAAALTGAHYLCYVLGLMYGQGRVFQRGQVWWVACYDGRAISSGSLATRRISL